METGLEAGDRATGKFSGGAAEIHIPQPSHSVLHFGFNFKIDREMAGK
jgi:hypothetical protein